MTDIPPEISATIDEAVEAIVAIAPAPVHVMLDLETWGTGNDALIVSIGACKFNDTDILDRFHVAVDPTTGKAFGREIDASTMLWWLDPAREEARRSWLELERVDLGTALYGFATWLFTSPEVVALWGNGSTFDNVILRSAFAACGVVYPVQFWQDQCYRTMKYRAPEVELVREGVHHNALDDAISQARHLQAIVLHLDCGL